MRAILAVLIGGAVGTGLRLGTDDLMPHFDNTFPWSTLIINIVGSLVLGLLIARVWPVVPAWLRAALGPGLLGGFTTFSAVMASLVTLTASGHALLAIVYLALSLVFGIGAAALGLWIGTPRTSMPMIGADE
jgi:fluoride exporter